MINWQPGQYLKFATERTQPSIDLVNRVPLQNPATIIDIGCGPGNSTAILQQRWPNADILGMDSSEEMLAQARASHPSLRWLHKNASEDLSALGQFDLVFSNAALQWMPQLESLLPKLFAMLANGGVLAAQVPFTMHMPVYTTALQLSRSTKWAAHFSSPPAYPQYHPYPYFYDILRPLTDKIHIWQTDYVHVMAGHDEIAEWYQGSGLRSFLQLLPSEKLQAEFYSDYRQLLPGAYPAGQNGEVLFPFTRIFFLASK